IEVAAGAVSAAIMSGFPAGSLPPSNVSTAGFDGEIRPRVTVAGTSMTGTGDLTITLSLTGTVVHVTHLAFSPPGVGNPPPAWLSAVPIDGTVAVTDRLGL